MKTIIIEVSNNDDRSDFDLMIDALQQLSTKVIFIRIINLTPKYGYSNPFQPSQKLTLIAVVEE